MREIKFRAWDKENKKFLKPYREQHIGNWVNTLSINMDGSLSFHEDDGFGGKSIGGESIEKRFELIQYTGLKDKNGVEIYEGDIIRGPHDFGPGGFSVIAAPVKYHVIHGYQLHYFLLEQTEVIGNIYENPELLGNKQ